MKVIFLGIAVLGAVVSGYFLIKTLTGFFGESFKTIERNDERDHPSRVLLTEKMTDEEIMTEIRRFREICKNAKIILFDSDEPDSENKNEKQ